MDITVNTRKTSYLVTFPEPETLDKGKLAIACGVSRSLVAHWIKTGEVSAAFIPILKSIDADTVRTRRYELEQLKRAVKGGR